MSIIKNNKGITVYIKYIEYFSKRYWSSLQIQKYEKYAVLCAKHNLVWFKSLSFSLSNNIFVILSSPYLKYVQIYGLTQLENRIQMGYLIYYLLKKYYPSSLLIF